MQLVCVHTVFTRSSLHNHNVPCSHRVHAFLVDDGILHSDGLDVELAALLGELVLDRLRLRPKRSLSSRSSSSTSTGLSASKQRK